MALLTISVSFPTKSRFSATFSIVLRFGESWNPKNCEKFDADGSLMARIESEKHATKSHLPKLIFRSGRSGIGDPERVSAPSNAEMKLHGVSSTGRVLKFVHVFVHAVGGAAPLNSPRKNVATAPTKNSLRRLSAWQTPSNCRHFLDNLYQIQFSDCSALPESRLQSLPHPYSPLRDSALFRISRNPV